MTVQDSTKTDQTQFSQNIFQHPQSKNDMGIARSINLKFNYEKLIIPSF